MKRKDTVYIVVHCSATTKKADINAAAIRKMHLKKGWRDIGYHTVIKRDGTIEWGRLLDDVGSHAKGFNTVSVSVCLVGGKATNSNRGENNFTKIQFANLKLWLSFLKQYYPEALIVGHRDLFPDINNDGKIDKHDWLKECPSFSVTDFINGG